eukprot:1158565-Pelagomonas_calceolata.AAC.2
MGICHPNPFSQFNPQVCNSNIADTIAKSKRGSIGGLAGSGWARTFGGSKCASVSQTSTGMNSTITSMIRHACAPTPAPARSHVHVHQKAYTPLLSANSSLACLSCAIQALRQPWRASTSVASACQPWRAITCGIAERCCWRCGACPGNPFVPPTLGNSGFLQVPILWCANFGGSKG